MSSMNSGYTPKSNGNYEEKYVKEFGAKEYGAGYVVSETSYKSGNMNNGEKKEGSCYKCGEGGHWANKCPSGGQVGGSG